MEYKNTFLFYKDDKKNQYYYKIYDKKFYFKTELERMKARNRCFNYWYKKSLTKK